ncbi:MAG TPA: amidohydrolase family protein [Acidimicrobiia bacterium]|nr:amidohydrolase family protein [Acidimicrobiia bacterium]
MTTSLVLKAARVVDARGVVAERADIVVDGPSIKVIGQVAGSPADTVVDVSGRTVCPGLMNAHVHVCFDGTADPEPAFHAEGDVETALKALPRLHEILAQGVTTVRDLGGKEEVMFALARLVADGIVTGPQIVAAGRVVTMTGGHGHWMGIEVDGTDEARKATRRMIKAGARVIKVMATAGMMTSGQIAGAPQLTVAEMAACVEEAHKAGLPVAAHVESRQGAANAIEAGVDSIEHGHGLDDALLERMVQDGIALVPTIACDRAITRLGPAAGIPQYIVDDCARLAPSLESALGRAIELGVTIAAGNDGGAPLAHPGDIVDELEVYVELGMTPLDALASATINTAKLFGLADTGLVEAGHRADLVVVSGDPLLSVTSLRQPDLVIAGGRLLRNDTIDYRG